jgi:hypothetical protein
VVDDLPTKPESLVQSSVPSPHPPPPKKRKRKRKKKKHKFSTSVDITTGLTGAKRTIKEYCSLFFASKCNNLDEMDIPGKTQINNTDSRRNRKSVCSY